MRTQRRPQGGQAPRAVHVARHEAQAEGRRSAPQAAPLQAPPRALTPRAGAADERGAGPPIFPRIHLALIPSETLELIRSRLDIVELVGEHVPLTRAGRSMKARCPFHQERSPSFIVSPERQTFHCFGCGEGGDAFSFVMKSENLSFMEAAEKLALRAGVKIEADRELGPADKERIRLREANEFAAHHYHELLKKDPAAEAARAYAAKRRLKKESVEGFLLGFAPRNGTLVEAAKKKGFSADLLITAGLAAKRADGSVRDYFFDRFMFPIRDAKGAFVGFGGRTLGDGEPKYLNTAETPVFSKSRVLYGLYEGLAQTRKARKTHLMEGYMDVISAHQHGLKNACAPLGTALTPEHALLIKRYVDKLFVVFDADAAGQAAAVRGAEAAISAGIKVLVATIPEGKDPDELLHAKGLAALEEALGTGLEPTVQDFDPSWRFERIKGSSETSRDLVDFKTELLIKKAGELTPESKSAISKEILLTIAQSPDDVVKDEWVRRLAHRLGITEDSLRRAGGKAIPQSNRRPLPPPPAPRTAESASYAAILSPSDLQLLGVLLKTPGSASEVLASDLESASAREIVAALRTLPLEGKWAPRLLDALQPAERAAASRLLNDDLGYDDPAAILRELTGKRRAQRRLKEIEPLVLSGNAPVDPGLRDEFQRLIAQLKGTRR
ncbi:MAG: DNA primase [Elusimicrobia bacterium]|nr:DNA primase [Elusimicrobiota bacterium]